PDDERLPVDRCRWPIIGGAEGDLDHRRASASVELALLFERDHQQVAAGERAADAPLFGLQMDALAHRRPAAVHLAQLEHHGVEEIVDHALAAAHAAKSA